MRIAGKKVIDAKHPVMLTITDEDCKRGSTKDPGGCAAALAARRKFHAKSARVHLGRVHIETPKVWIRYMTPQSLKNEIIAFDRGGYFDAGTHRLAVLQPSKRTGLHYGGADVKARKKAGIKIARIVHHITTNVRHHLAK